MTCTFFFFFEILAVLQEFVGNQSMTMAHSCQMSGISVSVQGPGYGTQRMYDSGSRFLGHSLLTQPSVRPG